MDLHEAYVELKDTLQRMGIDIGVVDANPPIIDVDAPQAMNDLITERELNV